MGISLRLSTVAVALTAAALPVVAAAQSLKPPGQGHSASASEAVLLPKYCWAQYMDIKGPEYWIDGCGAGINHYCWGLVELQRANKSFGNQNMRLGYLRYAKANTVYTLNAIKQYPSCWLRPHAESTYKQVDAALRAYGAK